MSEWKYLKELSLANMKSERTRELSSVVGSLEMRYQGLRRLLAVNSEMLELMADLETDLYHLHPTMNKIRQPILNLVEGALILAEDLNFITDDKFKKLYEIHRKIENAVRSYFKSLRAPEAQPFLIPLQEAGGRTGDVGGKASNLGVLRALMPDLVPSGFVITTSAYWYFLEENNLHEPIRVLLKDLSLLTDREIFKQKTSTIRKMIVGSDVPRKIAEAIADGVMTFPLPWPSLWAVRSSSVGEDGQLSFAGQFDSFLNIPVNELQTAYKKVLASKYTDRAVLYRLVTGFTEVDTPMAVLFLPMINARSAGVLYTRDPREETAEQMVINAVKGLADNMVKGEASADYFVVSRSNGEVLIEQISGDIAETGITEPTLSREEIKLLVEIGLKVEEHFGTPQDIEWVLSEDRKFTVVQARKLSKEDIKEQNAPLAEVKPPILEGGFTIFAGRAVGKAFLIEQVEDLRRAEKGSILVVHQAIPEISSALPHIAGVLAEHGNVSGHAATLIRELRVPAIFGVRGAFERIKSGDMVSIDATRCKVYSGVLWQDVVERMKSRFQETKEPMPTSANKLHDLILALNLIDPLSPSFKAGKCKSVHDIIRFTHEKAVTAMFDLSDKAVVQKRQQAWKLFTELPLAFLVLDIGGAVSRKADDKKEIPPSQINSLPFQALWRGISHPSISWAGRTHISVGGFMSVVGRSMSDAGAATRKLGAYNYILVAPDYLNLNARLAYHFAMIDSLISNTPENNYVNFRFRGGGAGGKRRELRARFLSEVLLKSKFNVDRRGDLVTAWLRRHPRDICEEGLSMLGKLMGCARQLDMLMDSEASLHYYIEQFLAGNYQVFS